MVFRNLGLLEPLRAPDVRFAFPSGGNVLTLRQQALARRNVVTAALKMKKKTSEDVAEKAAQEALVQSAREGNLPVEEMVGKTLPMETIPVGMWVQGIELHIGQGPKLSRASGCFGKIIRKGVEKHRVVVRLPSGVKMVLDSRCTAVVGPLVKPVVVKAKLYKAGQNRWKGIRPTVRGCAKNPCDLSPRGGRTQQAWPWGRGIKKPRKIPWELKE